MEYGRWPNDKESRRTEVLCGPPQRELKLKEPGGLRGIWGKVRPATAQVAHRVAEPILRVGHQGLDKARAAGKFTAHKVIGLQRSASLPERLVEKSARSTLERPMIRESDRAWQQGYELVAQKEAPHMFEPVQQPQLEDRELG